MTILLGAVADDFTGATDLANTLVKEGMRVCQVLGAPNAETDYGDAEAVVVALKSRTAPVAEAVEQSLTAMRWLQAEGAKQIISKYCSTFDSTADGNIGPIADAMLDAQGGGFAFVCPAFPANKRTIYQGHLFVGPDLLSDSSMKDHPLTPMRDASLVRLMEAQSSKRCGLIPLETVREGASAVQAAADQLAADGFSYGVVDALTDDDLRIIGYAAKDHALITGGSGVATGLPKNFRNEGLLGEPITAEQPSMTGRRLVMAGSCSTATRAQIDVAKANWPTRMINVHALAEGDAEIGALIDWAMAQGADQPILLYSSADPAEVKEIQAQYGVTEAGEMVERAMGIIASSLHGAGFDRILVAGGETSGAVTTALKPKTLRIAQEIATGVPWTEALGGAPLALALKSGNFGGPNFFAEAFEALE